ncbi:MAG: EamA family transporter [Actinobacteria bacterium]|nr:EamA family transporter [Actinomycetota bacterium]
MSPTDTPTMTTGGLPYWGVICCALFVTASEVCLKKGADATQFSNDALTWLGIQSLASLWVWAGILCYIISFVFWLKVLRVLPLSIAFSLASIEHVFVPIASYVFLGEAIGLRRAAGIGVVLLGVWVIAEPYSRVEEKA